MRGAGRAGRCLGWRGLGGVRRFGRPRSRCSRSIRGRRHRRGGRPAGSVTPSEGVAQGPPDRLVVLAEQAEARSLTSRPSRSVSVSTGLQASRENCPNGPPAADSRDFAQPGLVAEGVDDGVDVPPGRAVGVVRSRPECEVVVLRRTCSWSCYRTTRSWTRPGRMSVPCLRVRRHAHASVGMAPGLPAAALEVLAGALPGGLAGGLEHGVVAGQGLVDQQVGVSACRRGRRSR